MKRALGWLFFIFLVFGLSVWTWASWEKALRESREARQSHRVELPTSWRVIADKVRVKDVELEIRLVDGERVATLVDKFRPYGATLAHTLACNGWNERSARHLTPKTRVIICGPAEGGGIAGR